MTTYTIFPPQLLKYKHGEFLEDFYSICFSIPEIKTLDTNLKK